jgi:hypothetical protein
VNWLQGSAVMANSWQMLRGGRSPTVLVVRISCRWLKYIHFRISVHELPYCVQLGNKGLITSFSLLQHIKTYS